MSGWYVMHRGWMDSFKPEPFSEREAFLWSIEQAAFQDHEQWFNGHRFTVQRGEFVTSLRLMEKAFGWSVKRVRGFMERMRKCQKWAQRQAYEGAQSPTVISVCNYAYYQAPTDTEGTVEGTAKGTRRAQSGHSKGTQQNKGNKGNKKEESPSDSPASSLPEAPPALPMNLPAVLPAEDAVDTAFADYQAVRRAFVPNCKPLSLGRDRRTKLAARLDEIGGGEGWGRVLASIRGSPFLRGETAPNYRFAEIDWILEPRNLRKITEGNYDDRSGSPRPRAAARASPLDAMRTARANLGLG
jgi:hypothetical protein